MKKLINSTFPKVNSKQVLDKQDQKNLKGGTSDVIIGDLDQT